MRGVLPVRGVRRQQLVRGNSICGGVPPCSQNSARGLAAVVGAAADFATRAADPLPRSMVFQNLLPFPYDAGTRIVRGAVNSRCVVDAGAGEFQVSVRGLQDRASEQLGPGFSTLSSRNLRGWVRDSRSAFAGRGETTGAFGWRAPTRHGTSMRHFRFLSRRGAAKKVKS